MEVYFEDIERHILDELTFVSNRLLIAVAWFSNIELANKIIMLSKKDVVIEIIVDDNKINRKNQAVKKLISSKIDLKFIKNLATSTSIMHNKFCIIDNKKVITGSYNWTRNAKVNNENVVIIKDQDQASFYSHEFRIIKTNDEPKKNLFFDDFEYKKLVPIIYRRIKNLIKNAIKDGNLL